MARPSLEFTFILGTFYKYVLPKINKETTHIYLTVSLQKQSRVFKQIDNSLNLCAMFILHSIYYPQTTPSETICPRTMLSNFCSSRIFSLPLLILHNLHPLKNQRWGSGSCEKRSQKITTYLGNHFCSHYLVTLGLTSLVSASSSKRSSLK